MDLGTGNPEMLEWLQEWYDEARTRNQAKYAATLKKAVESMRLCPVTFGHPSEAAQLRNIGPKIVEKLEQRMMEHCLANGLPIPKKRRGRKRPSEVSIPETQSPSAIVPQSRPKDKPYIPRKGTGGYGILLALFELMEDENDDRGWTKDEIIPIAQPYCPDSSYTVPSHASKYHTAWNSVNTLDKNNLIVNHGRPKRYFLNEEGYTLAQHLNNVREGRMDAAAASAPKRRKLDATSQSNGRSDIELNNSASATTSVTTEQLAPSRPPATTSMSTVSTGSLSRIPLRQTISIDSDDDGSTPPMSQSSRLFVDTSNQPPKPSCTIPPSNLPASTEKPSFPLISPADCRILEPGSYTVQLLIDNREIRSSSDRDYIPNELAKLHVPFSQRPLTIGDACWIAKPNPTHPRAPDTEYILPHLLERKRLDDLVSSIKDRRFHEQKFRLSRCGIPPQQITYLIEDVTQSEQQRLNSDGDRIATAKAETMIGNGFFLKQTYKLDETIRYLASMTKALQTTYEKKELYVIPSALVRAETYASLCADLRERHGDSKKTFTIPLETFGDLTDKSGALNLRDLYIKMLMCVRGVSGEKAIEIQKIWPTPKILINAFFSEAAEEAATTTSTEQLPAEKVERKDKKDRMVLKGLNAAGVVGRKKISLALSKKIKDVWGC